MKKIDIQSKERKRVTAVQALALLAISAGALKTVRDDCIISRVDTKADMQECINNVNKAINSWPENLPIRGRRLTQRHLKAAQERMVATTTSIEDALSQWGELEYSLTARNRAAVLLAVCERALLDLYARLNTKTPRVLVKGILEPLQRAWKILGKDGALMSVHDESGVMVEQLQGIIGW